ncbi:hypothetical protein AB1Y20_015348 [Prymnesium parvum]|uniref:PDZ domain-containing protein n=1 Tax=Prymnesium parvum TaxID=97485 RepID=A0AB34K2B4_PRYPA
MPPLPASTAEAATGRAMPAERKAPRPARSGESDVLSSLPDDNMEIPHPDNLTLGQYAEHLYRIFVFKGKESDEADLKGHWNGMQMALIKFNIMNAAHNGELWLPPQDWMPPWLDDTRLTMVSFNTTLGLVMNEDPHTGRTIVKRLLPKSPAVKRGVMPGMFLISVNGQTVSDKHYKEVKYIIREAPRPVRIEFSTCWPPRSMVTFFSRTFTEKSLGIALNKDTHGRTIVTRCMANTPASRLNIPSGTYIYSVAGQLVEGKHFKEVQLMCQQAERPLTIEFSSVWPARPWEPSANAIPLPKSKAAQKTKEKLDSVAESTVDGGNAVELT